jgi:hypothetical protein
MPEMLPSSPKIHNHASLRVDYWSFLVAADEATARGVTHWSARLLGEQLQIGFASVARIWRKWDLQPWRTETFKFSTDPELDAKIRDVVGLYVNPPEKAVVLCIDEKSQIQALNRTAPILPIRPGLPESATHDYVRHGTTTLFAALEVATGRVEQACLPRHRHQEFLTFLRQVAKAYPRRPLHLVCDNYATRNFFGIITRQAIRRGTYNSVDDLIESITTFINGWNDRCHPFVWTKDADTIIAKAHRKPTSGTEH